MTIQYREAYGIFAVQRHPVQPRVAAARRDLRDAQGHPGRRRDPRRARRDKLYLGNLDAQRDWGFAPEYVEAMWRMLQQDEPDDFVVATGEMHTVREFVELAFRLVGLDWQEYVAHRPALLPPDRGRRAVRRRDRRRASGPRLEADDDVPRARPDHARRRPRRGRARSRRHSCSPRRGARLMGHLAGRRVMVTGGGGFLGQAVVAPPRAAGAVGGVRPAQPATTTCAVATASSGPSRGRPPGRRSSTSPRSSAGSAPTARTRAASSTRTRSWASS